MTHICLPKYTPIYDVAQWQCGCGKYFNKEEATKQLIRFAINNKLTNFAYVDREYVSNLIAEVEKDDFINPDTSGWKPELLGAINNIMRIPDNIS